MYRLKDEIKREIQEIMKKYPDRNSVLLPALRVIQNNEGYISEDMIEGLAEFLGIPSANIKGVISFYTMFNRKPVGRFHIQVCRNLSCSLMGAEHIIESLKRKLGIEEGETTKDGLFTLSTVECLGSCGTAPVMMINDDYYENVSEEILDKLIRDLKHGKGSS